MTLQPPAINTINRYRKKITGRFSHGSAVAQEKLKRIIWTAGNKATWVAPTYFSFERIALKNLRGPPVFDGVRFPDLGEHSAPGLGSLTSFVSDIVYKIVRIPSKYLGFIFKQLFAQIISVSVDSSFDIGDIVADIAEVLKANGINLCLPFSRLSVEKMAERSALNFPKTVTVRLQGTNFSFTIGNLLMFLLMGPVYPFREVTLANTNIVTDDSSLITIGEVVKDVWVLSFILLMSLLLGMFAPQLAPAIISTISSALGVAINYKRRTDLKRFFKRQYADVLREINENETLIKNIKFSRYAMQ